MNMKSAYAAIMAPKPGSLYFREALFFLTHTRAFISEMFHAEWRDVDLSTGIIRLSLPHRPDHREIVLPPEVLRILKLMNRNRQPQPRDRIFLTRKGSPMCERLLPRRI